MQEVKDSRIRCGAMRDNLIEDSIPWNNIMHFLLKKCILIAFLCKIHPKYEYLGLRVIPRI